MKFKKNKLKEFANVNMGQSPRSEFYNTNGEGMPFLQGVRTFREMYPYIDTFTTKAHKIAEKGEILFTVRAPVGDVNICPEKICIGRGLASISSANNIFLYYLLRNSKKKFNNVSTGTIYSSINKKELENLEFMIPNNDDCIKIANILFSLDKKIEVNNKIIANLEEQAQALFKSWFVDFEPFQDGNFVESELGMIPEGWEVKTIGEISKIRSGKRPENKLEKGDIPIYGANGITGWTDKVLINEPSILIGRVGTLGKVQRLNKKIWASDNTLIFTSQYLDFLYFNLLRIDYNSLNRGSTQPLITQKDISNINIVYPDINVMDDFLKNIGNYFTYIFKLEFQNKKLAEIRDALLPRLMSGEIDVSNIKIKGEEVKNE